MSFLFNRYLPFELLKINLEKIKIKFLIFKIDKILE